MEKVKLMSNKIKVLDNGFVEFVDKMGDDKRVVETARISYNKSVLSNDRTLTKQDISLLNSLIKNGHLTPFEHLTITLHIKAPIFVTRQWMRHRTQSYSELSLRYTNTDMEFYVPNKDRVSEEDIEEINKVYEIVYKTYKQLIDNNVPKEVARIVLPVGQYTEFYTTINIRNLMHFLDLRLDKSAQYEIRVYAEAILKIFEVQFPYTCQAYLVNK